MNYSLARNLTKSAIWRVTYTDGGVVWEKDPANGKETLFKEVDQTKIKYVDILNPIEALDDLLKEEVKTRIKNSKGDTVELTFKTYHSEIVPIFHLELEEWQRLILFKRRLKKTGQYLAVLGDPEMLDDDLRRKREEETGNAERKPQVIPYSLEQPFETIILIGWQSTIGDKNVKSVCMVYSDGHIEMKPDR
tara:strand:- start:462 stop:1037 length:576 start_codon:yes stop_codon:yes gene_type:complete